MTFSLTHMTKARLSGVNVRSEHHGGELVPAVDVKLSIDAMNSILFAFDPMLQRALYCRAIEGAQREIEGIPGACEFPNLRFPKLDMPLRWTLDATGYKLTVDYGLGGDSNLVLESCTIGDFKLTPKEGGTVLVGFRVQKADIAEDLIGKLATLVQHDVQITLEPPEGTNPLPFDSDTPTDADDEDDFPVGSPEAAFAATQA